VPSVLRRRFEQWPLSALLERCNAVVLKVFEYRISPDYYSTRKFLFIVALPVYYSCTSVAGTSYTA
jgi:hypothetical protein